MARAPKLLTYEQWEALHQEKQQKAAERKERQREKRRQQWEARQAQQNYLLLYIHRMREPSVIHMRRGPSHVALAPDAEGDVFDVQIRPDKRSGGDSPISLHLTVSAEVSADEVTEFLSKVAHILLYQPIQDTLYGTPLRGPSLYAPLAESRDEAQKSPPPEMPLNDGWQSDLHDQLREWLRQQRKDEGQDKERDC
jgi:hypothetical protein